MKGALSSQCITADDFVRVKKQCGSGEALTLRSKKEANPFSLRVKDSCNRKVES